MEPRQSSWRSSLLDIPSGDADTRRRGRLLVIIALAMTLLALAFIPVVLATTRQLSALIILALATLLFLAAFGLARASRVSAGAYLLIGSTLLAISLSFGSSEGSSNTPFYMVLAVLFAGVMLPPAQIWAVLALAIVGVALGGATLDPELRATVGWSQALLGAPLLLVMVSLLTYLSAQSSARALEQAERSQLSAEQAGRELQAANASLEQRVAERTAELEQALLAQRAAASELQASLDAQRGLNQVIADLSVPIIPIRADTLVVPLVGNIDSGRAELALGAVLAQLEATRASYVIMDVTGVAVVDTQVAGALLRVAAATRLMGAETLLVGIRPEVAQALVHLGVDLGGLRTAASLQEGMRLL